MEQVDYVLPEVAEAAPLWETVRDCLAGQAAIRKRGTRYLPMPNSTDDSKENKARYFAYQTRGVFVNFTQRTLQGMTGTVFAKDAEAVLPDQLKMMYDDVDGGSVTLDQQAKQTLSDVIAVGRCGLLTDYPTRSSPTSRRAALRGEVRPTIQYYFAEQIINWRIDTVNGLRKLTMVVLKESRIEEDDGFKATMADQYRVLRLENGVYTVRLYWKMPSGFEISGGVITPKQGDGKPFDYIPFEFVGAENNDAGIDQSPMVDLANLNIAHYRNSCDFEEMVFMLGQPTPVFTGLSQEWVDDQMKGVIVLGTHKPINLPKDATADLMQITESSLAMEGMEHKERQAVALGARLVQSAEVARTAKEAGLEDASETSLLLSSAKNVNSAYARAIKSAARFAGAPITDDMGYKLNTDFDILRLDPAGRAELLAEWQRGILSFTEYRSILRRAGVATIDDDKAKAEIEADAIKLAQTLGIDGSVQNDGVTPTDKNAPPTSATAPVQAGKPKRVKKEPRKKMKTAPK